MLPLYNCLQYLMAQLKKRVTWKVAESISVFSTAIEEKENYFRLRKRKQTDEFFKQYFPHVDKDFLSIKNHMDNLRRSYRKKCMELRATGNNDGVEELNGSEELFETIKLYEQAYYPQGSNIEPRLIMEPGVVIQQELQVRFK